MQFLLFGLRLDVSCCVSSLSFRELFTSLIVFASPAKTSFSSGLFLFKSLGSHSLLGMNCSLLSFCFSFPCTLVSFDSSVDFVEVVQSKTGSNTIEHGILVTHHEFWVLLSLPSFRRRKSSNYSPHFYHLSSSPRFPGKVLFCTFRLCSCLVLEQRRKVRASR